MKKTIKKALEALEVFDKIGNEVDASVIYNGPYGVYFDIKLYETQDVYVWDRKHGLEKLNTPSGYPNLGWAILQSTKKEEWTRFSHFAIHNKVEKTLNVYCASMVQVKYWKEEHELDLFYEQINYESHITSSSGLSSAL